MNGIVDYLVKFVLIGWVM